MFKSMSAAAEQPTAGDAASSAQQPSASTADEKSAGAAGEASFQDTIRRTMERMQASGDQATAAAAESSPDDLLAEMMKQFGSGGDGLGEGSDEDFSKMLMGMMEQLTNKEILYEPMKELDEKFPEWLEKNREKTKPEELKQYEQQQVIVREIVAKFDEKTYADSNAADREYIVNRMQKVSRDVTLDEMSTQLTCCSDARSRLATTRPRRRHALSARCLWSRRYGVLQPAMMEILAIVDERPYNLRANTAQVPSKMHCTC